MLGNRWYNRALMGAFTAPSAFKKLGLSASGRITSKTPYSMGGTKRSTMGKRRSQPSFSKSIEIAKPAKHFCYNFAQTLSKGVVYTWSPTQALVRGVNDNQRIGDSATLVALKFNGWYNTNSTASVYQFRLIIGYSGEEVGAATLTNAGLGGTDLFQSNTAVTGTNGIINPKAFTKLYDSKILLNSVLASQSDAANVTGSVSLNNNKFVYQSDGSTYGKTRNLVVILIADDILATAAANAGGATMSFDFIFK